jgi:RimJ/RimL family protein N-acetyltransferase
MFGPRLAGRSCVLRPIREDELERVAAWFEDPQVTRTLLLRFPPTAAAEREWFDAVGRDPNAIAWGIEAGGSLAGTTSIRPIDWPNQHGQTGTVIADRELWGRGIGSEAMALRTEFAFTQTSLRKLNSSYLEINPASGRAQAKCGYREVGRRREQYFRDGRWVDEILTEVLREDWLKLAGERGQAAG